MQLVETMDSGKWVNNMSLSWKGVFKEELYLTCWPIETKQDPAGPSWVQKPLCVPCFLFEEKGFGLLGFPWVPESRPKQLLIREVRKRRNRKQQAQMVFKKTKQNTVSMNIFVYFTSFFSLNHDLFPLSFFFKLNYSWFTILC